MGTGLQNQGELQRLHGLRRGQRAPPPNTTFCVDSPLGAWVGPWWEYLLHEKWQMLQIGAFFLKSSKALWKKLCGCETLASGTNPGEALACLCLRPDGWH